MSESPAVQTKSEAHEGRALGLPVLKALFSTWRAATVYDENNNAYRTRRQELTDVLNTLFESGADCRVVYQNDYIFFNGERFNYDREFSFGRSFAVRLSELGIGGITIQSDAIPEQIDQAIFALAHADRRVEHPYATLAVAWSTLNITSVTISPLPEHQADRLIQSDGAEEDPKTKKRRRAQALVARTETVVQECWERVRDRNSFEGGTVRRVVHQLIDEVANDEDVLLEFAALKDFDEYTYYHSVNVAIYSIALGMRLGMDRVRLANLGLAALFHDIGKVRLPRDLITKPQEFSEDDWEQIRRHPTLGALTLASLRPIDAQVGTAMAGAFEHHLRTDLTGYPTLSRRRTMHLFSRIIAVCDAFDAMTSGRVYQKSPLSPDEAVRRLLYNGRQWYDPLILKAFVHVVGVFPIGTVARLSDNSVVIVIRNDPEDLYSPEVKIVRDPKGHAVEQTMRLSAAASSTDGQLHITGILDPKSIGISVADHVGTICQQAGARDLAGHDAIAAEA